MAVEELLGKSTGPMQPSPAHSRAAVVLAVPSMLGAAPGQGERWGLWHNSHPHMLLARHPKVPICS